MLCYAENIPETQTNPNPFLLALGFLVTLYATLITLFGLAWVLFLIGMIYFEIICFFCKILTDLRLDQRWRKATLRHQRYRQRPGGPLCYHG